MKALERAEEQQTQASLANKPMDVKAFVADIKKTAEEFNYQNRYIYEPTSGLYYDPETGYYYNAVRLVFACVRLMILIQASFSDLRTPLRWQQRLLLKVQ